MLGRSRRQRVYRATHVDQDRTVALKFISIPPHVDRQVALEKIHLETEILKKLSHPNLVKVYGAGVEKDKVFFAYELVEGESLASLLSRRGRLATDQAVLFGQQIAEALEYLHQNEMIHSKLTAEKILVQPGDCVKVGDLRLNRKKLRRWDSGKKSDLETAAYLAPEALTGQLPTYKNDFYSLGVILFEMLTGKMPFEPENLARLARTKASQQPPLVSEHLLNCPFWLDKIVSQLLQPDPRMRAHSAKAVVLALDQVQRLDKSKQTAAEQMAGSFNPLNAGVDKTEARRALGRKAPKKKKSNSMPIYQTSGFIVLALITIFAVFAFTLMPTPSKKLMARAKVLMESDQAVDWQRARIKLEKIMNRSNAGELADEAETLYYQSKRQSLINRVERGLVGLENMTVKKFNEAYQKEKFNEYQAAIEIYQLIVDEVDPEGNRRHVFEESAERLINVKRLLEQDKLAEKELRNEFTVAIANANRLLSEHDTKAALSEYRAIIEKFGESKHLKKELEQLQEKIAKLTIDSNDSGPGDDR